MDAALLSLLEDEGVTFKAVRLLETILTERFGSEFKLLVEADGKFRILMLGIGSFGITLRMVPEGVPSMSTINQ